MKKPKLASFYSGCGGAAKGFLDAAEEYDLDCKIVFMNDKDKDACETLEKNFKKIKPIHNDIKKISNFDPI